MSTANELGWYEPTWPSAALAGVAAGLLRPATVAVLDAAGVPAGPLELVLQTELPMWWVLHLGYSAAFGMLYSLLVFRGRLRPYVERPLSGAAVGAGYGVVIWAVNVLGIWALLTAYVLPAASSAVAVGPLLGHLSYGAVLGVLYPVLRRRM